MIEFILIHGLIADGPLITITMDPDAARSVSKGIGVILLLLLGAAALMPVALIADYLKCRKKSVTEDANERL